MLVIPLGLGVFYLLAAISDYSLDVFGYPLEIEPLMVCMIAASWAGHVTHDREGFMRILEKCAPYIFLPFFTLTGAALNLNAVKGMLPVAVVLCGTRAFSI